ncbi:MAG: hypothetical protein CFE25_03965 [Chitinophagaceae bacterium BSSC1]|nr:MAG: hypothetical protein CFE25_03965 [Chitinophagaceae bacterium BSSC1]
MSQVQKLRLNMDEINEDFFEDTRLLGIMAPLKSYQLCLQLNGLLGYQFRLNTDIDIHVRKKDRNYYFSVYQSSEPNSFLEHYLYHNQFDGEYLLPEFRHIDYLWLMKGDFVDDEKCQFIRQTVNSIAGVQLVVELTNEQIKNKGNMIF